MITIKKNDYKQPTEVREDVVQGICEAFLNMGGWSTFHPFSDGMYRNAHNYIWKYRNQKTYIGFLNHEDWKDTEFVKFNGAEMKIAFEELIKAGYYMYKVYSYGSWMGYICRSRPFYEGGTRVTEFTDFID